MPSWKGTEKILPLPFRSWADLRESREQNVQRKTLWGWVPEHSADALAEAIKQTGSLAHNLRSRVRGMGLSEEAYSGESLCAHCVNNHLKDWHLVEFSISLWDVINSASIRSIASALASNSPGIKMQLTSCVALAKYLTFLCLSLLMYKMSNFRFQMSRSRVVIKIILSYL